MPERLPTEVERLVGKARELAAALGSLGAGADTTGNGAEQRREVVRLAREHGLYGLRQPADLGGLGAGALAVVAVTEELAAANLDLTRWAIGPEPGALAVAEGTLRERYLEPFLAGAKRAAFAFTERRDAAGPTTAVDRGEVLEVSGHKSYVTEAAHADFFLTFVQLAAADSRSPAMLVVDRHSSGVSVAESFESLDGSHHAEVAFDSVQVPRDHILGAPGAGASMALRNIHRERLRVAAMASGLSRWVDGWLAEHLQEPHRRGTPLAESDAVRLRYGELRLRAFACRSVLFRTARLADQDPDAARNEIMIAKVVATEALSQIVDEAMQLAGGRSLVLGHPLERLYRRVRAWRLAEGESDFLRMQVARGKLQYGSGRI